MSCLQTAEQALSDIAVLVPDRGMIEDRLRGGQRPVD
jgi:hypothetical protein